MPRTLNLQIATFAGLGLPRTLNKPVPASTSAGDVLSIIYNSLPDPGLGKRLIVSTIDGRRIPTNDTPISSFVQSDDTILPLRLSTRLCGGKGGFGSQLRAAGGRMSSRKNRDRQNTNGSNRNLDGRRLRTIDEAKRLAQYLETKPEMERHEKEQRMKRWESVIQAAEETEEKIKSGKMGSNQGRLDAEYVENKELAEEKVRDAIAKAIKEGLLQSERTGSESSADANMEESEEDDAEESSSSASDSDNLRTKKEASERSFFGWDDEDEEDEEEEDDGDIDENNEAPGKSDLVASQATDATPAPYKGKGKGRAV